MSDNKNKARNVRRCSFCDRTEDEVNFLIPNEAGTAYICDDCLAAGNEIVQEALRTADAYKDRKEVAEIRKGLKKPGEIKAVLDQYVIGQEKAKIALSVAVYNHYKRLLYMREQDPDPKKKKKTPEVEIQKSNVLLLGPTGVGKTYLARTLAQILNVPFAIADATTLTQAGYVGEDVENILLRLIQAADYDIEKAETGIIYIDEIDKISRKSENPSITRDVSGEGVQQALLKILEGTLANVPPNGGRKHPEARALQIRTDNILFICGGAFDGLDQIIEQRRGNSQIGFSGTVMKKQEKKDIGLFEGVEPHDIVKYGLIPELVGRLPVLVTLDDLDTEALVRILKEPKNALTRQYQDLFRFDGIRLTFDDDALEEMARMAIERNIGARGLRSIMENLLIGPMFECPSVPGIEEIRITLPYVKGEIDKPVIVVKDKTS